MQTNISRIDESFIDYVEETKFSSDYDRILNKITQSKDKKEFSNKFVVYFDISLFSPPPVIKKLQERLDKVEENK